MHNVRAIDGGDVNVPEPNEGCVRHLKELLEKAEAGEITGVVVACLHGDSLASYSIAGLVGPYSLLGAVDMARADLLDAMRGQYE